MPERLRVLVCGSRTFEDFGAVANVLDMYKEDEITIIHGAARGADTCANRWAEDNDKPVLAFAADWNKYGKRAGYLRNAQMLEEGKPDVVWAFVDKPVMTSKGTAMMVKLARKAGVPTYVVQGEPAPPKPPRDVIGI